MNLSDLLHRPAADGTRPVNIKFEQYHKDSPPHFDRLPSTQTDDENSLVRQNPDSRSFEESVYKPSSLPVAKSQRWPPSPAENEMNPPFLYPLSNQEPSLGKDGHAESTMRPHPPSLTNETKTGDSPLSPIPTVELSQSPSTFLPERKNSHSRASTVPLDEDGQALHHSHSHHNNHSYSHNSSSSASSTSQSSQPLPHTHSHSHSHPHPHSQSHPQNAAALPHRQLSNHSSPLPPPPLPPPQQQQQQQQQTQAQAQTQVQAQSATETDATASSVLSFPVVRENKRFVCPVLSITGETVTSENIEDGYLQFVLHHDPQYVGDNIENLLYVKRKFSSVPRTGDLSYTTWDVFVLVKKLHNQELKNWSQLVGQLGLSDMAGRPQFAQRVKRWMHKYKIDCFFDYLLGNPYNFHSSEEKYSGCLSMGNYQKRKGPPVTRTDETDSMRSSDDMGSGSGGISAGGAGVGGGSATAAYAKVHRGAKYVSHVRKRAELSNDEDEELDENEMQQEDSGDEKRRTPIVLAGSRKRLKGAQIPHAAEVSRLSSPQRTDDEMQETLLKKTTDGEASPEDEEDELASTSSSAPSPVLAVRSSSHLHTHPAHHAYPVNASMQHAASPHGPAYTGDNTCAGCTALQSTVESLTSSLDQLREHISSLERRLELEMQAREEEATKNWSRVDTLCTEYDRWRKKLAGDLLSNPFASLRDPTSSSSASS
ncbi:ARS binding protein 2-domain-containing protein [Syncephalastrum racemosum]|uniref:ARS binding protein 2-domain-containing protein n=1 Tax=Syncephalastrum racemosum TaxID=13706 RepID=A0A1X2H128_SYNRA|nr:ARS binding protein 2-domain-containing protein [Syncephalastrum racemosum]